MPRGQRRRKQEERADTVAPKLAECGIGLVDRACAEADRGAIEAETQEKRGGARRRISKPHNTDR